MRAIALAGLLPLAGCAALFQLDRPRPEVAVEHGLQSYEQGDFRAAYDQFSWVYENFWDRPIGERALLALTAIELDPRNPGRRLAEGAAMASWHPDLPTSPPWTLPVSRTLAGLATEMESAYTEIARLDAARAEAERQRLAAEREAERARADAQRASREVTAAREEIRRVMAAAQARPPVAAAPPAAPTPSGEASALRAERDRLAREVQQLRNALASTERDLERVRQTITGP